MSFYPADQPVPHGIQTAQFLLEPLAPKHVALDYAALMASKAQLRLWGGHGWPADDFTLQDNMRDMHFHYREHRKRTAFTYTVLNPAGDSCLGCVYIRDLQELTLHDEAHPALQNLPDYQAMLRFWVRTPYLAQGMDAALLGLLQSWLSREWPFSRVLVHTPRALTQQITLLQQAGLPPAFEMTFPGRGGLHQFFVLTR